MQDPLFCPNQYCRYHHSVTSATLWYRRVGGYHTATFGRIQRFQCRGCNRYFSTQTFSLDYYAKCLVDYRLILTMLVSCAGTRAIARGLCVSTSTVANRVFRLARQAIAIHHSLTSSFRLSEDLAADGFESFVVSQYFPNNINLLAGAKSQYVYGMNYAALRRKGRMTDEQLIRREALEQRFRAPPDAIQQRFSELCDLLIELRKRSKSSFRLVLSTDEHPAYRRAISAHPELAALEREGKVVHKQVPSDHPRVPGGPLFAVDYLDRELRKDLADHVRETVRFARNVNNCMGRIVLYLVYHNCMKCFRIRREWYDRRTHAEIAGASTLDVRREAESLFGPRRFLTREHVSESLRRIWLRLEATPLKEKQEYVPAYARM